MQRKGEEGEEGEGWRGRGWMEMEDGDVKVVLCLSAPVRACPRLFVCLSAPALAWYLVSMGFCHHPDSVSHGATLH
jgi:hypothetical protein